MSIIIIISIIIINLQELINLFFNCKNQNRKRTDKHIKTTHKRIGHGRIN